jgi:hypothetical protein
VHSIIKIQIKRNEKGNKMTKQKHTTTPLLDLASQALADSGEMRRSAEVMKAEGFGDDMVLGNLEIALVLSACGHKLKEGQATIKALTEALETLVGNVESLLSESDGVYGFHLNGDVAPWGELDGWLNQIEYARETLKKAGEASINTDSEEKLLIDERTPAEIFAAWIGQGPKLALAADCYVKIRVEALKKAGDA